MGSEAVGFWSYARTDDEDEAGRITQLAGLIANQFRLTTGRKLTIFIDRTDLKWGDEWEERIDDAVKGTTFLIPIITPRYFQSEACRAELVKFSSAASSSLSKLILPILYADVAELHEDDPSDDAVARIAKHQRIDWRKNRLEDEGSSVYRKGLAQMAERLAEIANDVDLVPDAPTHQSSANPSTDSFSDDGPGTIELMAEAEDAWPKLNAVMEAFGADVAEMGGIVEGRSGALERASEKGSAHALLVLSKTAKDLDPVAESIQKNGKEFTSELARVDPATKELLRNLAEDELDEDGKEFIAGIKILDSTVETSVENFKELLKTMETVAVMSRDIRRPLATIRDGVRNVIDGQVVIREWADRARLTDPDYWASVQVPPT